MVVGIDFRKFLRVARIDGLPVIPSNCSRGSWSRGEFSTSSWSDWLERFGAPRGGHELGSARDELKGGGSGGEWTGRGAVTTHEESHGELGFRELPSSPTRRSVVVRAYRCSTKSRQA